MKCEDKVDFPTSGAPNMRTVYLAAHNELFREDSRSSSSVLERKLDFPECEKVKLHMNNSANYAKYIWKYKAAKIDQKRTKNSDKWHQF